LAVPSPCILLVEDFFDHSVEFLITITIIIVVYQGLCLLACSGSEFIV
jgi:hypothetical protein